MFNRQPLSGNALPQDAQPPAGFVAKQHVSPRGCRGNPHG